MNAEPMHVVATAGHVDHGKSTLVLALTGTDPDRWEEEKRRGLTIDLGFAFTTLPSGQTIGFVDVPGHVRFVKNMLAGVGAVRAAVFVVAATEGWMPQSEEHLRILELVGLDRGLTVLTKADLVDDETLELARLEVSEHLEGTFLADGPIVVCDAKSGRGVEEVSAALDRIVSALPVAADRHRPRMWIDRAFSLRGVGTVVTGTLIGGMLAIGDEIVVEPRSLRGRIRAIESAHEAVDTARPGTRVALNLAGVDHALVDRGCAVVFPDQWATTATFDVATTLLANAELPRRARLKATVGAGEHDALVRTLDERFARISIASALPLGPGDRVVLRDPGPDVTVGGGEVVDVSPSGRARDAPARLRLPLGERVLAGEPVLDIDEFGRRAGLSDVERERTVDELVRAERIRRVGNLVVAEDEVQPLLERTQRLVDAFHVAHPLETGAPVVEVAGELGVAPEVVAAIVESGDLVLDGPHLRRSDHVVDVLEQPQARMFLEALERSPFDPPRPSTLGVEPALVRALERADRVVVLDEVVMARRAYDEAVEQVLAALDSKDGLTVAEVRDLLGSSRRFVLPLLTRLDAEGITRRKGDLRVAGPRAR